MKCSQVNLSDGKKDFLKFDSKGRLWGSGNDSKSGDTVEESASTSTKYADPTVPVSYTHLTLPTTERV